MTSIQPTTATALPTRPRPHLHTEANPLSLGAYYGAAGWTNDGVSHASAPDEVRVRSAVWVTAEEHEDGGWVIGTYYRVDRLDAWGDVPQQAWPISEGEGEGAEAPIRVATRAEAERIIAASYPHVALAATGDDHGYGIHLGAIAASLGIDLLEDEG